MSSENQPRQLSLPALKSDSSVYEALRIPQPVLKPSQDQKQPVETYGGYTLEERRELEKIEDGDRRDING